MKTNTRTPRTKITTHEGAPAVRINAEQQLRRSVMACMLWENTFYEGGIEIAERIAITIPDVKPAVVAAIAYEARTDMKLRHVPLLLAREMARLDSHKMFVADVLENIIQRPDELAEFLAIYWKDGRQPLSAQVKRGLARAFRKFDAYALAKYNRDNAVKLRDVLFLTHAKPIDENQAGIWKKLVDGTLESPDTWEVALSGGADKRETFERLIKERKLGALAMLRNLRNMQDAGVPLAMIAEGIMTMKVERVLPFRFITAARYAPKLEQELEQAMFRCVADVPKLSGHTVILVDNSGSMQGKISDKTEVSRSDAACGLAILAREICDSLSVYGFSDDITPVPARRGFALQEAIQARSTPAGTEFGKAVDYINRRENYDRLIVISDEQTADKVPPPTARGYGINTAPYQNGVTYQGKWIHLDGFSEATLKYIREIETT